MPTGVEHWLRVLQGRLTGQMGVEGAGRENPLTETARRRSAPEPVLTLARQVQQEQQVQLPRPGNRRLTDLHPGLDSTGPGPTPHWKECRP